jgi:AAA+ superfamily predicted ATPase
MQPTATTLLPHLAYLAEFLLWRLDDYLEADSIGGRKRSMPLQPQWNGVPSPLQDFVQEHNLNENELQLLLIALAPHVQPTFFEAVMLERLPQSGEFPEFGGVRGKQFRSILPTGETAVFILAGTDMAKRFEVQALFGAEHLFYKKRVLWLEDPPPGEPRLCGKIILSNEYIELFTTGKVSRPHFSAEFPAKLVETALEWEDLILQPEVKQQVQDLQQWVQHNDTLLREWGMKKRLKPGYRVLFYGPPGTGKTFAASLLGKFTGKEVYRVDLSTVVSKYIGETEKNLATLFDRAEDKNWILFFDEADALFGKRSNVKDAHDRYANQEVSYLLQRIEDFNGLVILASNFKSNIDEAFMRRFNTVIKFPMPDRREREEIWQRAFPPGIVFEPDAQGQPLHLPRLASKYELSGGHIMNVIQYACLKMIATDKKVLLWKNVLEGIKREFEKEGRIFTD